MPSGQTVAMGMPRVIRGKLSTAILKLDMFVDSRRIKESGR